MGQHGKLLDLVRITVDAALQMRVPPVSEPAIERYREALRAGEKMPPVTVYDDGDKLWLADGFHTLRATMLEGRAGITAEIIPGSREDAFNHALSANSKHGEPRTRDTRRHVVLEALAAYPTDSDRAIATRCDVSNHLVAAVRESRSSSSSGGRKSGSAPTPKASRKRDQGGSAPTSTRPDLTVDDAPGEVATAPDRSHEEPSAGTVTKPNGAAKPNGANGTAHIGVESELHVQMAARLEKLEDDYATIVADHERVLGENESLRRVVDASDGADRIKAALAEAHRYRELARVTEERVHGLQGECNAAIRSAKSWQRKLRDLEKTQARH